MKKIFLFLILVTLIACGNEQDSTTSTDSSLKNEINYEIFSFKGSGRVTEEERGPIVKNFKEDFDLYVKVFDKNLNKQQLSDLALKIINTYKVKYPMCPKIRVTLYDETEKKQLYSDFWRKKNY
ncbi:MAG TPA: hypothetical protein PLY36_08360 [Spirochaetota bacterium]|nr:hypothetical protein [Spirochaetota bacterium]